jgi:hypothetical protein
MNFFFNTIIGSGLVLIKRTEGSSHRFARAFEASTPGCFNRECGKHGNCWRRRNKQSKPFLKSIQTHHWPYTARVAINETNFAQLTC